MTLYLSHGILIGGIPIPLKNMSSSDWIIIPTFGENKIHVPNHQPVYFHSMSVVKHIGLCSKRHIQHDLEMGRKLFGDFFFLVWGIFF